MKRDSPVAVARELLVGIRRLPPRGRWRRTRYELRFRDGGAACCNIARLDTMLDARRWPADFWAALHEADRIYEHGDDWTLIEWSSGRGLRATRTEAGVETLRHHRGWIESSRGYKVRARGRAGLDYADQDGDLRVDSEMMAVPTVLIYADSIPDHRPLVLERLIRAWLWAGFDVDITPPKPLSPS